METDTSTDISTDTANQTMQTDTTQDSAQSTDSAQTDTILSNSDSKQTQTQQADKDTLLTSPVSPVKPDGTFVENWRDMLPDEIKNEKSLDTVTDFNNAMKQLVNHKKMVGKDKVAIPSDKSDEAEWNEFYSRIGRPSTKEDYTIPEIPEDLSEIFTDDKLSRAKEIAFRIGATQKQFDEYLKDEVEQTQNLIQSQISMEQKARADAEKSLRAELGAAYDERMHVANRLIAEAFPVEEQKMQFLEKFGNDVDFIRFASLVGSRMAEHTTLIGKLTQRTPNEVQKRITELKATPGYLQINSDMTKEQRAQITEELRDLNKQLYEVTNEK